MLQFCVNHYVCLCVLWVNNFTYCSTALSYAVSYNIDQHCLVAITYCPYAMTPETQCWTWVSRVQNMQFNCNTKEPGWLVWQSERILKLTVSRPVARSSQLAAHILYWWSYGSYKGLRWPHGTHPNSDTKYGGERDTTWLWTRVSGMLNMRKARSLVWHSECMVVHHSPALLSYATVP